MSLDLSNPNALAFNTAPLAAADLSGVLYTTFDGGDVTQADDLILQVDTTAGDIDVATLPATLLDANGNELLCTSMEIAIVKNSTDKNKLTFTDPLTGIAMSFVDRQGESMTLVWDADNTRWLHNW